MLGTASKADEAPKVWWGISISPRRSLTLPATEADVRDDGSEEGDQAGGDRPERTVIPAGSKASPIAGRESA